MFIKTKKFMLSSLLILSSTIYADGLENSNTKHNPTLEKKPGNSKMERKTTASDSFERKKIYHTKYFKIYYDKNSVKQAQELIKVADKVAEVESKLFKMEIPKDIKVYVVDIQDNSNAFSTGQGIHLFVTNNGGITNEYKDYIPYLFSHELTHELLDYKMTQNGINKYVPMSDRIVLNTTIPRWWTEGMAVLVESMISKGGGRTFDPAFVAIAKRDLNEDKFRGVGPNSYNRPYEYGNSFMRFYLETYGIEKVSEAIDYYSKHKVGGIGRAFGHVAGVDADQLHDEWIEFIGNLVDDVKGDLVEGPSIFDNHSWNAQVIKDGKNIWTYSIEKREGASFEAGHKRSWLKFIKIPFDDQGNPDYENVKEYNGISTAIISNQPAIKGNNLYYSTYPKDSAFRGSADNVAYRYNLETQEKTLITGLTRPDKFVNVNGKIYYTFLQNGVSGISTLANQIVLEPSKYSISSLSDAGDNKILLGAKVDGEEGGKIFLLDLKTKEVKFLANGKNGYLDGKTLYFTDNFGEEVNNVYKKDLESDKIVKLTNVLYDASNPVVIDIAKEDKDSLDSNKKLVYLNVTTNGASITQLDTKYAVNEEKSLNTLEEERKDRREKNSELYGSYEEAYDPNLKNSVTIDELKNNNNKEVKGFYYPDFTKPSITLSNTGVGVEFSSANLNNRLMLSYEASSLYTGVKDVDYPTRDNMSNKQMSNPLYYSLTRSGHKVDKYSLGFIHSFSFLSESKFAYFHTEILNHGVSVEGKDENGDKNRSHQDEILVMLPFNIKAVDKSVYFSIYASGDLQNDNLRAVDKLYSNQIEFEFGYDRYSSYLVGDAKTKFGMVVKNKKTNKGSSGTNYFYVDRNIKSDIPYLKSLSFLNLRSRLYFAPKTFTDNDTTLTELSSNGLGFSSKGGNSDDVRSFITNARFAGKLYGDMNYTIPIEKGSDFGMVYLKDAQLRLGYSYTAFMDEDYNGIEALKDRWKTQFPSAYAIYNGVGVNQAIVDLKTSVVTDRQLLTLISAKLGITLTATNVKNVQAMALVANKLSSTGNSLTDLQVQMLCNMDNKIKPILAKYAKRLNDISYANSMAQNTPKKESKFRHGITINPSISLNGNLYNDSADFELSVGNTYMADFTDDRLSDTDFWYISAQLRF